MYLILVIGHTGQGKTPWVNKFLGNGHTPPVAPVVKGKYFITENSKQQYIFDVNNEYLFPDDLGSVKPQMRHISQDVKRFIAVAKNLRNTNIVFEDATGFLRGKQSEDFARLLTGKMFTQNNYIILFHSINRVPPELMEMSNYIILFKTNDNIDVINNKFKNAALNNHFLKLQKMKRYSYFEIKTI